MLGDRLHLSLAFASPRIAESSLNHRSWFARRLGVSSGCITLTVVAA